MKFKSQNGFSLVELMVTVAIIGILATLVVPMYEKFAFKAKQGEAKTQLSALYSTEKAFYAEYGAYHTSFQAIGYSPEGSVRYNIGFGSAGIVADQSVGYNTILTVSSISTRQYCGGAGGANVAGNTCNLLVGIDGMPAPLIPAVLTSTGSGYSAGAYIFTPPGYALQLLEFSNGIATAAQITPTLGVTALALQLLQNQAYAVEQESPGPTGPRWPIVTDPTGEAVTSDSWVIDEKGQLSNSGPASTCANVISAYNLRYSPGLNSCGDLDTRFLSYR